LYTSGRSHNKFVYAVDPCLEFSLEPLAAGHLTLLLPLLRPYLQKNNGKLLNILIPSLDTMLFEDIVYAKLSPFGRNSFNF
jgi:hypothetical protein